MPRVYLTPRGRIRTSVGLGPVRTSVGRTGVRVYPSRRGSFGLIDLVVYSMAAMLFVAVIAVVLAGLLLWLVGVLVVSAYKTYSVPKEQRVKNYKQRVSARLSPRTKSKGQ